MSTALFALAVVLLLAAGAFLDHFRLAGEAGAADDFFGLLSLILAALAVAGGLLWSKA